ncbi:MAG: uroporphyrinogen-III synthase [Proteobacteria bacterium]|nr:uroporphyrinogen-III synthase [Pseudomonadota bacterium]
MPQIIWTRALDDWDLDKKNFEQLNREALHLPCIALQGLPVKFPKQKPQIFVLTSANAVRYSQRHHALINLMRTAEAVYTIGSATQKALRDIRINAEIPPGVQSAEQLAVWMSRNVSPDTNVAWPAAREPSYNLAEHLARYAIEVDALPIYYTEKALHLPNGKRPDAQTIDRYIQSLEGAACFASPSAVDGFIRTLNPSENRLKKSLCAFAIGPTTQAAIEGHFDNIVTLSEPSVEDLAKAAVQYVEKL